MVDRLTPEVRSKNMSKVRGRDTKPELAVRRALFREGFRFRLHDPSIAGRPDIVLRRFRTAVFVHGCFWHGHGCPRSKRPQSNKQFWSQKLDRNIARDRENLGRLERAGWHPVVIWQCSLQSGIEELLAELKLARSNSPNKSRNSELA